MLSDDWIKLAKDNLFGRLADVLSSRVEKARAGRAIELDGHGLGLAAGHLQ